MLAHNGGIMRVMVLILVAAMLAPTVAFASEYPRHVVVDGMDCTQNIGGAGKVETWCTGWEGVPFLHHVGEAPSPSQATVSQQQSSRFQSDSPGSQPAPAYISMEAARALNRGALKLSWSGPMKWGGIGSSLLGLSFLASGESELKSSGAAGLISGLLFLGLGVALDFSAADDFSSAAGVYH